MTRYNRRTLLKASATLAGASALGFPAISYGQSGGVMGRQLDVLSEASLLAMTGYRGKVP